MFIIKKGVTECLFLTVEKSKNSTTYIMSSEEKDATKFKTYEEAKINLNKSPYRFFKNVEIKKVVKWKKLKYR